MPGKLFYIVGASGAGKDSIMSQVRRTLPAQANVLFAHRYITRAADAGGENHVAISPAEFRRMQALGAFALHWESHGLCYGIGAEIDLWLEAGAQVVVNGSRGHLPTATERYGEKLQVVLLTVSPEVLRARLIARARETPEEIESRIARASAFSIEHPRLTILANDGPIAEASGRLTDILMADQMVAHLFT